METRTVRRRVFSSGPKSRSIIAWLLAMAVDEVALVFPDVPTRFSYGSWRPGT